jgi:hypothetical protein
MSRQRQEEPMETAPSSHGSTDPIPTRTAGDAPAPPPLDPQEAFALFEILLHERVDRGDA